MPADCTWKGCIKLACMPQLSKCGEIWANLCIEHHKELDDSCKSAATTPGKTVRAWVLAHGGSKALAKKCVSGK